MSRKNRFDPGDEAGTNESSEYEVGYGKPPLKSRWQPGQSGNSSGRPKATLNLETIASILANELAELVSVQGTDGRRKLTKQQAFFKKLINDALTGSARDKTLLMEAIYRLASAQAPASKDCFEEVSVEGEAALQHFVDRAIRRRSQPDRDPEENDGEGSS